MSGQCPHRSQFRVPHQFQTPDQRTPVTIPDATAVVGLPRSCDIKTFMLYGVRQDLHERQVFAGDGVDIVVPVSHGSMKRGWSSAKRDLRLEITLKDELSLLKRYCVTHLSQLESKQL